MPGMDGLETLLTLRRGGCRARIAILTEHDDPEPRQLATSNGAEGFLSKECIQGLLDLLERKSGNPAGTDPFSYEE